MSTDSSSAIGMEPWSLASMIHSVDALFDDEGRPLAERRAADALRRGAPLALEHCRYQDERTGRLINVSALEQSMRYLPDICERSASFRAVRGSASMDWPWALTAVLDQLAAPAVFLLSCRTSGVVIPARLAAGCKVASGFAAVLRGLLVREMSGEAIPVSVEVLMESMHRGSALINGAHACPAPPQAMHRAAQALLQLDPAVAPCVDATRREVATLLARQVRLGIVWEAFDLGMERAVLDFGVERLRPRNSVVENSIVARASEMSQRAQHPAPNLQPIVPADLTDAAAVAAAIASRPSPGQALQQVSVLLGLLAAEEGGALPTSKIRLALARHFWHYLAVYRLFLSKLWDSEWAIRQRFGYPDYVPMKLHPMVLPRPKALHWFEMIWGHNIRLGAQPSFNLSIANHRRESALGGADAVPRLGATRVGW